MPMSKEVIQLQSRKRRRHSLFRKVIIPLLIIMVCQSAIFILATMFGGVSDTLDRNARDILTERVINNTREIETKFSTKWANFETASDSIGRIYNSLSLSLEEPIYSNADTQREFLSATSQTLIKMLRANEVTGVFLILNDSAGYTPLADGSTQTKYGICIRDYSPLSEYNDNDDLLIVRCPSSVIPSINCALETWWEALFTFDGDMPGDYYYKPLAAAYQYPDANSTDLAYFCGAHDFGGADRTVVSYSIPLMDADGYPYAVLGVELTTDYLKTLLPGVSASYGAIGSFYALVQYYDDSDSYDVVTYSGVLYQQCFGTDSTFSAQPGSDGLIDCSDTNIDVELCGSLNNISIYNHNTPFESQRLALAGVVRKDLLYGISRSVENRIFIVSLAVMVLGVISVFITSRRLSNPIKKLAAKVRNMDGSDVPSLDRLNIDEIDDLVESIEQLSDKVNRNLTRTEFFSRMSHDMRTPMNAIIGFSAPELTENADEQQLLEYLDKIHTSGGYLLSLINEVLDMTKIESQRMEIREEVISLAMVARDTEPIIREVADARSIKFAVDYTDDARYYYGDRQRLTQILVNLLSNAVKFSNPGGTVRMGITVVAADAASVTYRTTVHDDGIGMSEEFQKRMYEPFTQEGLITGGTGLGLSIAKQMIELMGGTLSCESTLGKGTTFTIQITHRLAPAPQTQSSESAAASGGAAVENASFAGKRALLCEDHPLNAQIAMRLLERKSMKVDNAVNGMEGLRMFKDSAPGTYDIILMDIRMPELNGLETARAIRALDRPDAQTIPIIAMTANAFNEDVQASRDAGMNEHLSKPIDPKILYITLAKYL